MPYAGYSEVKIGLPEEMSIVARSKNAGQRRKVLATLAEARRDLRSLQHVWDVSGTVYVSPEDRAPGSNAWGRERQEAEYPENTLAAWAALYNVTDEMIKDLTAVREQARTRFHEIKEAEAQR
jgi:hypothetical protein